MIQNDETANVAREDEDAVQPASAPVRSPNPSPTSALVEPFAVATSFSIVAPNVETAPSGTAAAGDLGSPPGSSPPMILRSGRKKRRRHDTPGRNKRAAISDSKRAALLRAVASGTSTTASDFNLRTSDSDAMDYDETETEGHDDTESEGDRKLRSTRTAEQPSLSGAAVATAPAAKSIMPVSKLRLPSQHTPNQGRTNNNSNVATVPAEVMFGKRLRSSDTISALNSRGDVPPRPHLGSVSETVTTRSVPNDHFQDTLAYHAFEYNEEQDVGAPLYDRLELDDSFSPWARTSTWTIIFVLLHVLLSVLSNGEWMTPMWHVDSKRLALYESYYQVLRNVTLGASDTLTVNKSVAETIVEEFNDDPVEEEHIVEILVDNQRLAQEELELLRHRYRLNKHNAKLALVQNITTENEAHMQKMEELGQDVDQEVRIVVSKIQELMTRLQEWERALEKAENAIFSFPQVHETDSNKDQERTEIRRNLEAKHAMEQLSKSALVAMESSPSYFLDGYAVKVPGEGCEGMDLITVENDDAVAAQAAKFTSMQNEEDPPIHKTDLERSKLDLVQLASFKTLSLMLDEESVVTVRKWIADQVRAAASDFVLEQGDSNHQDDAIMVDGANSNDEVEVIAHVGLTEEEVQSLIDRRLEQDRADLTGRYDYASIRLGATVIRTGPRKTSASLVDTLPLGNYILAKTGMRFYGHSAEAALNPTYPKNALGQCWSFEREGTRSVSTPLLSFANGRNNGTKAIMEKATVVGDAYRGEYATLAVNLARPVYVTSVVIEHPPKELSPSTGTAVANFRVTGFEGEDASGKAWPLGAFRYEIDGPRSVQEFDVRTAFGGAQTSPLKSAVLAVDSNWSANHTCLYRFRVHGH